MATLGFSLVIFALFFLHKLKILIRKRVCNFSLGRSKLYAVPETEKTHLEANDQRQQMCGMLSFPAPVPNLGCNIEEPMDWTDSSGDTRRSNVMSTTITSSPRVVLRPFSYMRPGTSMSYKIRSYPSSSKGILSCYLVRKSPFY